jgi:hypothetical protein
MSKEIVVSDTPWGGSLKPSATTGVGAECSAWQREYCIRTRAENEPETLMTDDPDILRCPVCLYEIKWVVEDEAATTVVEPEPEEESEEEIP